METINKNKNFFLCDKYYNVYYSETDKKKKIDNVSRKNNDNSNNLTNDFEEKINNDSNIYYFGWSDKKYTDEELLKMNIYEISIGFHPTKISNDELISFHPFFYLKLNNEEEIGLVIQYLKLNEKELINTHM